LNDHEKKFIKGAQANLWTEYITNMAKLEYMLFPRIAALSEVVWSLPATKNWPAFEKNIPALFNRYQWWKIRYCKAFYDLQYRFTQSGQPPLIQLIVTSPDSTQRIEWEKPNGTPILSDSSEVSVPLSKSGVYTFVGVDKDGNRPGSPIHLPIQVNRATGSSISLRTQPNATYANGGPLTLVDGIRNTLGMSRSSQFLGFWGTDLDATLDLGVSTSLSVIRLHCFEQPASWIYAPEKVQLFAGNDLAQLQHIGSMHASINGAHPVFEIHKKLNVRYIKIIAINKGTIPDGQPGSGHEAWLFADEISVE
jgi:hexosaminidase